jgi:hypothetical protein
MFRSTKKVLPSETSDLGVTSNNFRQSARILPMIPTNRAPQPQPMVMSSGGDSSPRAFNDTIQPDIDITPRAYSETAEVSNYINWYNKRFVAAATWSEEKWEAQPSVLFKQLNYEYERNQLYKNYTLHMSFIFDDYAPASVNDVFEFADRLCRGEYFMTDKLLFQKPIYDIIFHINDLGLQDIFPLLPQKAEACYERKANEVTLIPFLEYVVKQMSISKTSETSFAPSVYNDIAHNITELVQLQTNVDRFGEYFSWYSGHRLNLVHTFMNLMKHHIELGTEADKTAYVAKAIHDSLVKFRKDLRFDNFKSKHPMACLDVLHRSYNYLPGMQEASDYLRKIFPDTFKDDTCLIDMVHYLRDQISENSDRLLLASNYV